MCKTSEIYMHCIGFKVLNHLCHSVKITCVIQLNAEAEEYISTVFGILLDHNMLLSFDSDFSCSEIPDSFCFMYFEYFLVTASFALTSFLPLCADSMLPVTALALTNFFRYEAHSSSSS